MEKNREKARKNGNTSAGRVDLSAGRWFPL
jgi:hypothetical protein